MSDIQLTTKQASKVERAIKALNDVRREVEKTSGTSITWYLEDSENLHLMEGESHDDQMGSARYDAIIESYCLDNSGGGGW